MLVYERVWSNRDCPVSPLFRTIDQLNKDVAKMRHETVLI